MTARDASDASLPAPFAGGVAAPAATRVDRGQLAALVRLSLGQALRRGVDMSSGASGHPLLQLVVSLGVVGLMVAFNVTRAPDADAFLARVFFGALLLTGTALVPDTPEVRDRHVEILFSKPVAVPTHLLARAITLGALALCVALPFGLPGILAAAWRFDLPLWRPVADVASLLIGAFSLALLWLQVLVVLALRLGFARVRRVAQSVLMLTTLAISVEAALGSMGFELLPRALLRDVLPAMPSTWFARFAGSATPLERAGALLLALLAPLLYAWRGLTARDDLLERPEPLEGLLSTPPSARLVGALAGRGLSGVTAGLAVALVTLSVREDAARLKARATLLVSVGFFVWGLRADDTLAPFIALCYFVPAAALDGLLAVRQSAHPEAAWTLRAAPLDPAAFVAACQWAVVVRYVLPSWLMVSTVLVQRDGWLLGLLLALTLLAAVRLLLALALALQPTLPLAQAPRAGQGIVGMFGAWFASLATLCAYALLWALTQYAGRAAPYVVALGLGACLAAGWAAGALAGARMRGVELEG